MTRKKLEKKALERLYLLMDFDEPRIMLAAIKEACAWVKMGNGKKKGGSGILKKIVEAVNSIDGEGYKHENSEGSENGQRNRYYAPGIVAKTSKIRRNVVNWDTHGFTGIRYFTAKSWGYTEAGI